jgi:hypothetical protein
MTLVLTQVLFSFQGINMEDRREVFDQKKGGIGVPNSTFCVNIKKII